MTAPVFINGKFTAQQTTGVQRVAARLVQALDQQVAPGRWVLLCPPAGTPPPLHNIAVRRVAAATASLHLWEQLALPWAARSGLLLNLAGSAPALARRQAALLHDAAVFDHPEAYTPAFVAWYRWLFRRLARRGAQLFTVSAFSRAGLAQHLGLAQARLTVLHNGADHLDAVQPDDAVLDRLGLRGTRYLLAVASANPTKNLPALVAAFARLQDPALRLVIVGGGNARVFAGHSGVADPPGVLRAGPLPDAPLKALYQQATALVFPSLYEGFGLPPLEAMACGCPVAAARVASIPEVCGDAALYFDPADTAAIAAALRCIVADAALRGRLQQAGRSRAALFRWADAATQLRATLAVGSAA